MKVTAVCVKWGDTHFVDVYRVDAQTDRRREMMLFVLSLLGTSISIALVCIARAIERLADIVARLAETRE